MPNWAPTEFTEGCRPRCDGAVRAYTTLTAPYWALWAGDHMVSPDWQTSPAIIASPAARDVSTPAGGCLREVHYCALFGALTSDSSDTYDIASYFFEYFRQCKQCPKSIHRARDAPHRISPLGRSWNLADQSGGCILGILEWGCGNFGNALPRGNGRRACCEEKGCAECFDCA